MANTYTQIYIHIVFAVQGRQNLLRREHEEYVELLSKPQAHFSLKNAG